MIINFYKRENLSMKKNGLRYQIGQISGWNEVAMQVNNAYIEQMRKNVADDLNVGIDDVNIKATTTEKLGFEGRGEGISATAVVLLK